MRACEQQGRYSWKRYDASVDAEDLQAQLQRRWLISIAFQRRYRLLSLGIPKKKYSVLDRKLKIQLRVVWNSDDDDDDDQNICKPIGTLLFEFLRK